MQKIMLVDHRHSDSLLFILWVLCGSNMVKSFKIITAEPFFFLYQKPKANIPVKICRGKPTSSQQKDVTEFLYSPRDSSKTLWETLDVNN